MIFLAVGSISDPEKLGPYIDEEMRVLNELRNQGAVRFAFRRSREPGVFLLVDAADSNDAERQLQLLPFVDVGLLTFEMIEVREL